MNQAYEHFTGDPRKINWLNRGLADDFFSFNFQGADIHVSLFCGKIIEVRDKIGVVPLSAVQLDTVLWNEITKAYQAHIGEKNER